jgi:hypothetical protein
MAWHGAQKEPTKPKAKKENAHSSARKRATLRGITVLEGAKRRTSTPQELTEDPKMWRVRVEVLFEYLKANCKGLAVTPRFVLLWENKTERKGFRLGSVAETEARRQCRVLLIAKPAVSNCHSTRERNVVTV